MINTTNGAVHAAHPDSSGQRRVNTTAVVEENLIYEDEASEVSHVLRADGYVAVYRDGRHVPLVFWAVQDNGQAFGVAMQPGVPLIDVSRSAGDEPGFVSYEREEIR